MGTFENVDQHAWVAAMKRKADDLVEQAAAITAEGSGGPRTRRSGASEMLDDDGEDEHRRDD